MSCFHVLHSIILYTQTNRWGLNVGIEAENEEAVNEREREGRGPPMYCFIKYSSKRNHCI